MAHKLMLARPYRGMPHLWNVTEQVGDNISCSNRPTDVDLVKILLGEAIRARRPAWVHGSMRTALLVNGQMDALTAYWIRVFNAEQTPRLSQDLEGIISPARGGAFFAAGRTWTIVNLNLAYYGADPTGWAALPRHPQAKPALAAELR